MESNLFPRRGLASLNSTKGSTWQGYTVDPLCNWVAMDLKLSDPQFLPKVLALTTILGQQVVLVYYKFVDWLVKCSVQKMLFQKTN